MSDLYNKYRVKLVAPSGQLVGFFGPPDNHAPNSRGIRIVASPAEALVLAVPVNPSHLNELKSMSYPEPPGNDLFFGAERVEESGQEWWSFRALTSGSELASDGRITALTSIWSITSAPEPEIRAIWPNEPSESLTAIASVGGTAPSAWMRNLATGTVGPNQQTVKMVLEHEDHVPPVTNARYRVKVLRLNGAFIGHLGPPRFSTADPGSTSQIVTSAAGALVLEAPLRQPESSPQIHLKMEASEWPDYLYLGIMPGIGRMMAVTPGLWHFRACNADAQANTDIKATAPPGAVLIWSIHHLNSPDDELRVYWPASNIYLTPRVFTSNAVHSQYFGAGAETQLWLLSDAWREPWYDSETVKLVLERL
ncbi:hypothetical protein FRB93_003783 [Tulasnella sp. JGI-2019a]|nr:hypothetical protein FRB93_003783 [Tulasnella sp. JGI-2019a]